jgi:hypothetical protein
MDGMPEHLFELNAKTGEEVNQYEEQSTFEMINFKHKAQQREKEDAESSQGGQEKKPEQGSYLSKLAGLAEKLDGSIEESMPVFGRFNS